MRTKFKPWAEPYINEHPEVMMTLDELSAFNEPFYLEIGSGKGQFLVDMAKKFPDKFFIGVERNVTCAGFTAKKLVEEEITNAKLIYNNADLVLGVIKNESVQTLFLNFSDPWPKKRHEKRRLTAPRYLESYYNILSSDAKLIFKTDNSDLFAFSKEVIENSKFKVESITDDYQDEVEFDAITEYEASFRAEGVPIHRLVLVK